eukprot:gene40790-55137_t
MRASDLLLPMPQGLYCPPGDFYIDPVVPVASALITHGHSDHARPGHGHVLATQETLDMMRLRYGENFAGSTQAIAYGEMLKLGDVTIKCYPAGHVLGSAQIAVTCQDICIVAAGDYKDAPDPTCTPFEVVPCDVFITEATFGLPVFPRALGDPAFEEGDLFRGDMLVGFSGRHAFLVIGGEEAKNDFAFVGLAGGDGGITGTRADGVGAVVEAEFALAVGGILAVALEAVFGENGADVA